MASETDVAWAAGLFEGEGYLSKRIVGKRIYLQLGIEMCDEDVVQRFVDTIESSINRAPRPSGQKGIAQIRRRKRHNPKHNDLYTWKTVGHTAREAYELLRPHLGHRRQQTGDTIITETDMMNEALDKPRLCLRCGTPFPMRRYGHNKRFCSRRCQRQARALAVIPAIGRNVTGAIPGTRPGDNLWR